MQPMGNHAGEEDIGEIIRWIRCSTESIFERKVGQFDEDLR